MAEICPDRRSEGIHSSDVVQHLAFIGTENPIPKEMDHRKITVRVPVMNEVQFLFARNQANR